MTGAGRVPARETRRALNPLRPRSGAVQVPDFQKKSPVRTPAQFYRLPEPQPGERVHACIRPLHWAFGYADGAEMVLIAKAGDVTSDTSILRRFSHYFRPLSETRQ